jgi:drug/metabolite transporter (DMT)-like permease
MLFPEVAIMRASTELVPMASLYSLMTIPFAIWQLNERIDLLEAIGIALALVAVVALGWEKTSENPNQQN